MTVKNNQRADRGKNRKAGNAPAITAEEKKQQVAKELRIKPKTKEFYDEVINNPKITQQEAYIKTHKTNNKATANVNANKLLKSTKYSIYKASAVGKAKRRIVELVDSDNEQVAFKASESIIDRVEGKAVQHNETINKTVEVKLDLTGVKLGNHYLTPAEVDSIT
jgi:hypothetical protein